MPERPTFSMPGMAAARPMRERVITLMSFMVIKG